MARVLTTEYSLLTTVESITLRAIRCFIWILNS